jgi:hypothetical protein
MIPTPERPAAHARRLASGTASGGAARGPAPRAEASAAPPSSIVAAAPRRPAGPRGRRDRVTM